MPLSLGTPYLSSMSRLSCDYYRVPVNATDSGSPYNPAGDPVQFAFAATATYVPQSRDWITGRWEANPASILYPYNCQVLVGPDGAITLGPGTYQVYVKVTGALEVTVEVAGRLQVF